MQHCTTFSSKYFKYSSAGRCVFTFVISENPSDSYQAHFLLTLQLISYLSSQCVRTNGVHLQMVIKQTRYSGEGERTIGQTCQRDRLYVYRYGFFIIYMFTQSCHHSFPLTQQSSCLSSCLICHSWTFWTGGRGLNPPKDNFYMQTEPEQEVSLLLKTRRGGLAVPSEALPSAWNHCSSCFDEELMRNWSWTWTFRFLVYLIIDKHLDILSESLLYPCWSKWNAFWDTVWSGQSELEWAAASDSRRLISDQLLSLSRIHEIYMMWAKLKQYLCYPACTASCLYLVLAANHVPGFNHLSETETHLLLQKGPFPLFWWRQTVRRRVSDFWWMRAAVITAASHTFLDFSTNHNT